MFRAKFCCSLHAFLSARRLLGERNDERGSTLAELLVVLVIVSILAVVAAPSVEVSVERRREVDLRETLRTVRQAIDRFHDDWQANILSSPAEVASDAGYPKSLQVLVDGVETTGAESGRRRYLRRYPVNPFRKDEAPEEQWQLIGYADPPDAEAWGGRDVYDIKADEDKEGLDGTIISDW